jgi:hypothetical protein
MSIDLLGTANWVVHNWDSLLIGAGVVIGLFSVIARLTPWEFDNRWADACAKAIHSLGQNKQFINEIQELRERLDKVSLQKEIADVRIKEALVEDKGNQDSTGYRESSS